MEEKTSDIIKQRDFLAKEMAYLGVCVKRKGYGLCDEFLKNKTIQEYRDTCTECAIEYAIEKTGQL